MRLQNNAVQAVEKPERAIAPKRKIEGQGEPRPGKGHEPRGGKIAELLDYPKEGPGARVRDSAHDFLEGVGFGQRHHALVLQQAALAIDAIPIPNRIQGIEEWIVVNVACPFFGRVEDIVERVKGFHADPIEGELGKGKRDP